MREVNLRIQHNVWSEISRSLKKLIVVNRIEVGSDPDKRRRKFKKAHGRK